MPLCGRRRRIGVCDRRVSWRLGIERRRTHRRRHRRTLRHRRRPVIWVTETTMPVGRPPATSSTGRCGSTTRDGRSGWRSPGTITRWRSRPWLVGCLRPRPRRLGVGVGVGVGSGRLRALRPAALRRPVGSVPSGERVHGRWGTGGIPRIRGGRAATGRGTCAARTAHWLLEYGGGRNRRRGPRAGRGRPSVGVRCRRGPRSGGSGRFDSRPRAGAAGSNSGATGGDRSAGQGMPVPRLQLHGVHECPSHRALGRGRPDQPGQLGHALRAAPPCGPRVGLEGVGQRRRRSHLHGTARAGDAVSAVADLAKVICCTVCSCAAAP